MKLAREEGNGRRVEIYGVAFRHVFNVATSVAKNLPTIEILYILHIHMHMHMHMHMSCTCKVHVCMHT